MITIGLHFSAILAQELLNEASVGAVRDALLAGGPEMDIEPNPHVLWDGGFEVGRPDDVRRLGH